MIDTKDIWIKTGYETFAHKGAEGLKIETLAKKVGISKSSFYHHFADLELFLEQLLAFHVKQACVISEKEKKAEKIDPDLINILVEHKTDLLFNRQLRFNRQNKLYAAALAESNKTIGNYFVFIWMKDLNLSLSQNQLEGIFELALENFFLQINNQNIQYKWLSDYFGNLKRIVRNFS